MKRKTEPKVNIDTPVREEIDEVLKEVTIEPEEQEVQPVKAQQERVYRVKCVWSGPVKIAASQTPSGKAYDFQPQQEQPVEAEDVLYLTNLKRGQSGCCNGSDEQRTYFQLV